MKFILLITFTLILFLCQQNCLKKKKNSNLKFQNIETFKNLNSTSTTTSSASSSTFTFSFDKHCKNQRYINEKGILEARCNTGIETDTLLRFNLNTCMDFKNLIFTKGGTGNPGIRKNCNCIVMPKLVCQCRVDPQQAVGTIAFPTINLDNYVTVVDGKPYCRT
jgi:hypothetical protein